MPRWRIVYDLKTKSGETSQVPNAPAVVECETLESVLKQLGLGLPVVDQFGLKVTGIHITLEGDEHGESGQGEEDVAG